MGGLSLQTRHALAEHMASPYREATPAKKHVLLDEFTQTTGYHCTYARWLLNQGEEEVLHGSWTLSKTEQLQSAHLDEKRREEWSMTADQVIEELKLSANPQVAEGMARFGIRSTHVLGIAIPVLRKMAKRLGPDHPLAFALWASDLHEARILASMVADPRLVSEQQMETWVKDFNSWDICDQVCGNLFDKTPYASQKAIEWCHREQEFVRRAGFVMMAELAVHEKQAPDEAFLQFFPLIKLYATDERNFVKKAVNWALRQIGKRNPSLRVAALACAEEIKTLDSKTAQWIAKDALKELHAHEGLPAS